MAVICPPPGQMAEWPAKAPAQLADTDSVALLFVSWITCDYLSKLERPLAKYVTFTSNTLQGNIKWGYIELKQLWKLLARENVAYFCELLIYIYHVHTLHLVYLKYENMLFV